LSIEFIYHPAVVSGRSDHQGYWLYFCGEQLLVKPAMLADPENEVPWTTDVPEIQPDISLILGTINGVSCQAACFRKAPRNWLEVGVRDYLTISRQDTFKVVNAASQLIYWLSTQNYCSRCGSQLEFDKRDRCLICLQCQYRSYPKISPCVIVTIIRGRQILLAQSHRYRNTMFSCLAGFIECGESAEEAIIREVREEVSIMVKNIRYVDSQAWPFPHQLMLGYLADYAAGEIVKEDDELRAAAWFDINALPVIPPPQTIARKLIEQAVEVIQAGT
jgi:NAD+ diphosphatase